jgi:hypothetical protein
VGTRESHGPVVAAATSRRRSSAPLIWKLDGADMRREPIEVPKALLAGILRKSRQGVRFNEHPDGIAVFQQACKMGLDGIRSGWDHKTGPLAGLAQVQEPRGAGCETGIGRGLGPMSSGDDLSSLPIMEAVRIVCEVHTVDSDSPQGFNVGFGVPPDFASLEGGRYWEAWRVLREYSAGKNTRPSTKAVKLFQRAIEIQAAKKAEEWEPEGRRNEYIAIDIALMRELRGSVWGVSALDVDETAEGPPPWVTNPWEIESWREAISWRRALLQAVREMPETSVPGGQ